MDARCPERGENCPGNSATKWLWTLASSLARVPPWTNKQIPHLAQNVVVPKISNTRGRFQRSASRMGKWCRLLCRRIRSRTRHSGRKTLKQHLAMHAATLTTYEQVCAVVVSYLPAKTVWIPTATYAAGHTARARDPDAMNVDKSMTRKAKEKENRRKARKEKAKEKATAKRAKKANTAKTQGKTKKGKSAQSAGETIPQECWYNAKGQGKQSKDGTSGKGRGEHPIHQRQKHVHCSHVSRPFRLPRGHPRWEWRIGEIRDPSRLRSRTCNANREKNNGNRGPKQSCRDAMPREAYKAAVREHNRTMKQHRFQKYFELCAAKPHKLTCTWQNACKRAIWVCQNTCFLKKGCSSASSFELHLRLRIFKPVRCNLVIGFIAFDKIHCNALLSSFALTRPYVLGFAEWQ